MQFCFLKFVLDHSNKIAEIGSRLNSTSTNTAIMKELQKRRKFRKYKRTYAELLEGRLFFMYLIWIKYKAKVS